MKTKFTFLLALMLLFPYASAFADGDDKHNKIGGIRGGWQYSGIFDSGTIVEGYNPLNSFYVGLFRENKLIPLLALGTGVEYSQVGMVDSEIDNSDIKLHYISVPIDLRVKLGPVYALGGFALNFRVAEKWRVLGENVEISDENKSEVFDLPLFVGAGVQLFFLRIEARYHWGMLDVYKASDNIENPLKGQYFQVGLGVSF